MSRNLNELLLKAFRYHGTGEQVNSLLEQGALFDNVNKLLLETFHYYKDDGRVKLLLAHGASFAPSDLNELLSKIFQYHGDGWRVDLLLEHMSDAALFPIVRRIKNHRRIIKILPGSSKENGVRWPIVSQNGWTRSVPSKSILYLKKSRKSAEDKKAMKVSNQIINVSKTILSARSDFFQTLLQDEPWFKKPDLTLEQSAKTMEFILLYAETEPEKVDWSAFLQCEDVGAVADRLDELLEILVAASFFLMDDLLFDVQSQVVLNGNRFIQPENVTEVMTFSGTNRAELLEKYCTTFLELNTL
ncbi:hypothetical protein ACLOAV_010240 [Pseudogymnoascus australis]